MTARRLNLTGSDENGDPLWDASLASSAAHATNASAAGAMPAEMPLYGGGGGGAMGAGRRAVSGSGASWAGYGSRTPLAEENGATVPLHRTAATSSSAAADASDPTLLTASSHEELYSAYNMLHALAQDFGSDRGAGRFPVLARRRRHQDAPPGDAAHAVQSALLAASVLPQDRPGRRAPHPHRDPDVHRGGERQTRGRPVPLVRPRGGRVAHRVQVLPQPDADRHARTHLTAAARAPHQSAAAAGAASQPRGGGPGVGQDLAPRIHHPVHRRHRRLALGHLAAPGDASGSGAGAHRASQHQAGRQAAAVRPWRRSGAVPDGAADRPPRGRRPRLHRAQDRQTAAAGATRPHRRQQAARLSGRSTTDALHAERAGHRAATAERISQRGPGAAAHRERARQPQPEPPERQGARLRRGVPAQARRGHQGHHPRAARPVGRVAQR
eukprot:ctg_1631.g502